MQIFNIQIWGEDADKFMALDCEAKKEWIKENTNQKNDELIEEFLKAAIRGNDEECQGCKDKKNGNISKGVQSPVNKPDSVASDTEQGNGADTSGQGSKSKEGKKK